MNSHSKNSFSAKCKKRFLFFNAIYSFIFALLWTVLSSELTNWNYIFGFAVSYLVLIYVGEIPFPIEDKYKECAFFRKYSIIIFIILRRIWRTILLIFYFFYELVRANFVLAFEILTPPFFMKPAVIAYPLDLKTDFQISIFANFITLTPGSLTIDVSEDKKIIYIHSMYVKNPEKFVKHLKNGLEKKILKVLT